MEFFLNNYKIRLFFLVLFIALLPIKSMAQEAQKTRRINPNIPYTFSSETGTYTYLDEGIVVQSLSVNEAVSNRLPLGFSFQFGCETYTDFYASSNGTISFNNAFNKPVNSVSSLAPANVTVLAPLWDNLRGDNGIFSYKTTGTAPNRVFTAEWKNWKGYWDGLATISFQVKLYEGSNTIEYCYNQEPASSDPGSASIGIFNGVSVNEAAKQLWLNNSSENPVASTNFITNINILPATGQVYRFTHNDNDASCDMVYYGQTMINKTGGTNANDGLRITLSGAANMQIKKGNVNQISSNGNNLLLGTSNPYGSPNSTHGVVLAVGKTYFTGGSLVPPAGGTRLEVVSSTQQSRIESPAGHFVNEIKLAAVKNDLTYYLTIKYTYDLPDNHFFIDYTVTIPEGNTEEVKLAHGWDTYLQSSNSQGPGFVTGTAPNLVVGTKMRGPGPSYEAFEYMGGVPWSGYFSAYYISLPYDLGSEMTFKNTINTDVNIDNGIGISMNFGSTPGNFTSSNKLVLACEAGDAAPTLVEKAVICQDQTLNLNSLITSPKPPEGVTAIWRDAKGTMITDPTKITAAGTYSVYYFSKKYSCFSPSATVVVAYDTCGICYKPGVTTGTEAGSLTIISTLDRKNHPAVNPRNGALILESKEKGFAISKVASPETTIAEPVEGMLVFDTTSNCLKLYNGIIWNCLEQSCIDND